MRKLQGSPSRLSRLMPTTRTQKRVVTGGFIVVLLAIAFLMFQYLHSPNKQVSRQVAKLDKPNISCEQIRSQLGNDTQYSQYSLETQKKLLEKQMICFSDNFDYDRAIPAAQKLEAIYAAEHDETHKAQIEMTIQAMKTTQQERKAINGDTGNANAKQ